jgi:serine/threonine-protein kinase
MGSVYFATQAPLTRPVALKVLHGVRNSQGESEESFRRRFLLEASILSKLQHPNIVVLFEYGQIANLPGEHYFMAMEYLRGETLARRFKIVGRLGTAESLRLARQIGRGLREAHRSGFIHRDLKPSNIMLVPDDEKNDVVKLVDFGIGKVVPTLADPPREADATQTGLVLGSPRYMSPEQIRSEPVEPRTDLYALGVILFEALTGRVPFPGDTSFDIMASHCLQTPPELSDICPGERFPPALCRLVASLLQKQASQRLTAEQFLGELSAVEQEMFGYRTSVGTFPGALRDSLLPPAPSTIPPPASLPAAGLLWAERPPPPGPDENTTLGSARWATPGSRKAFIIAAALGIGLCLMLGRYVAIRPEEPVRPAQGASAPPPVLPATGSSAVVATPQARNGPAPSGAFVLSVESLPAGASVLEDGKVMGATPLDLRVDRATVANAPRKFVLQLPGYVPTAFEQGDSEADVNRLVTLAPLFRGRGVPPTHLTSLPAPDESNRPKRDETSGLDIRLRR